MSHRYLLYLFCAAAVATALPAAAQSGAAAPPVREHYDLGYIGAPLADAVVQHAKETYVSFGCAYCHGVNLVPRGEAPDLRRSQLVARDQNGSTIVPLLKAGIPQTAKLSPMPQFSDLSDQQLHEIATWIHYARRHDRVQTLTEAKLPAGDAAAGKTMFEAQCSSCHTTDLTKVGGKYDAAALRAAILNPKSLDTVDSFKVSDLNNVKLNAGREKHHAFVETVTQEQVANLAAYLQTMK